MDASYILYYLFGLSSIIYIFHLGFYLVTASFYDIWQHHRLRKLIHATDEYTPHVTVLIPAHNEEKVIERCLDSVFDNTYSNIDIIVVNDASTDTTRRVLASYKKGHPEASIRIINKRINAGKGSALNYALKRYTKGELVMSLDADSILAREAIERAVTYFVNPKIDGVAANVQIMNEHTTLSILQKFEHMISYRSKKAYSLTNSEYIIGGVASTYRMSALRAVRFYDTDTLTEDISVSIKIAAMGNLDHRIIYGADIMAMTEPVESLRALFRQRFRWKYGSLQNIFKHTDLIGKLDSHYSTMLTMYRLPAALITELALLLLPLVWGYVIYLTLSEKSLLLIFGAYLTVTAYMYLTLWHDEHIRPAERLYLSIYVPITYFVFYVMDVIQVVAVIVCLARVKNLSTHKDIGSTWISPTRIGDHMEIGSTPKHIGLRESIKVAQNSHE